MAEHDDCMPLKEHAEIMNLVHDVHVAEMAILRAQLDEVVQLLRDASLDASHASATSDLAPCPSWWRERDTFLAAASVSQEDDPNGK